MPLGGSRPQSAGFDSALHILCEVIKKGANSVKLGKLLGLSRLGAMRFAALALPTVPEIRDFNPSAISDRAWIWSVGSSPGARILGVLLFPFPVRIFPQLEESFSGSAAGLRTDTRE